MSFLHNITEEFKLESELTRRYLIQVPFDKFDFKPSEKSEPLGRLAIHIAEILAWWSSVIHSDGIDFTNFTPKDIQTKEELLIYFDTLLKEALASLSAIQEDDLYGKWSMSNEGEVYFTLPKIQVLRIFCMNHLIHHRSQLGVYLRLLNIPVPATYGPSADDFDVILKRKFDSD